MTEFIEITSEVIEYIYNGDKYAVTAEDNDIIVCELCSNYSSECDPEEDLEYWVGALIYHYEINHGSCWVASDYRRAAQICLIEQCVLDAKDLESICEISPSYGIEAASYDKAVRNLRMHKYAKKVSLDNREGAD